MEDTAKSNLDCIPNFGRGFSKGKPNNSSILTPSLMSLVSGPNRCKYFNCPLPRTPKPSSTSQLLDQGSGWTSFRESDEKTYNSVATQTIFRESEVQTDPWDPPFKLKTGSTTPEILTLQSLHYGEGLPVTEVQLREISSARTKRILEATKPSKSVDDVNSQKRHEMLMQHKISEMNHSQEKRLKSQKKKLAEIESELVKQIEVRNARKESMLNNLWKRKSAEQQQQSSKLYRKLSLQLLNLKKQKSVLTKKYGLEDIFQDSELQASCSETALAKVKTHQLLHPPQYHYLESAKGLVELERWMWEEQKIVMEPEICYLEKESHPSKLQKIIDQAQKERLMQKITKPIRHTERVVITDRQFYRQPTPTVPSVPQHEVDQNNSSELLQKVIIGREVEKEIFDVCRLYENLTVELKKTQALSDEEQAIAAEHKMELFEKYLQSVNGINKVLERNEVLSRFEGKTISTEMNVLGKMVHCYEQFKIVEHFVLKAKDERRRREAEEAGRRQTEALIQQALHQFYDEIYGDENYMMSRIM